MGFKPFSDTITILRAPLVEDEYGTPDAKRDWYSAISMIVNDCMVQPQPIGLLGKGEYLQEGRDSVTQNYKVFCSPDTDIEPTDRVLWEEELYEVEGAPTVWAGHHIEIYLKKVVG